MSDNTETNATLARSLRRAALATGVSLAVLALGGCQAFSIGTKPDMLGGFEWKGFGGNAHADLAGLMSVESFNDAFVAPPDIVKAGLLWGADKDDWVTLDIWPVFGIGAGAAGARVRLGPAQAGAGFGFTEPTPLRAAADWPEAE